MLSITALSRLETVAHSNGTTRLCQQWDITHDWGCALLFWQLGLEWGTMIGMGTPMERDYEEGNYHSVAMTPHINDTVFIHAAKRSADGKKEAGRLDFYEVWVQQRSQRAPKQRLKGEIAGSLKKWFPLQ